MYNSEFILSGERFQNICRTFLGTSESISYNPNFRQDPRWINIDHIKDDVCNSRIVYIHGDHLYRMYDIIKFMKNDFILISHNSDENIDNRYIELLENKKIIRLYSQNLVLSHPKAYFLPIGLANSMWPHGNLQIIQESVKYINNIKNEIYFNFSINTNKLERQRCFDTVLKKGVKWENPCDFKNYLQRLKTCKYSICPVGNGIDTHRFWESVYLGVIPIVERNPLIDKLKPYFRMVILDNWADLDTSNLVVNEPESNFNHYLQEIFDFIQINILTTLTGHNGRLGNQIIRNLAVSLIAEKHNIKVNYHNKDLISKLGIELFSGANVYQTAYELNDTNYFLFFNSDNLNSNLEPNGSFFQTKDITNFLYDYLHTEKIKSNIIQKNPFKTRYNTNNDMFIHIRLTDAARFNPGINYYLNTIKAIEYNKLYISTDEKTNDIVQTLIGTHPEAELLEYDEINTFQFASTCKNIVLSHGSFSAIIGYLSFFSNVYYPEYEVEKIWYGDMFSIKNWNKFNVN